MCHGMTRRTTPVDVSHRADEANLQIAPALLDGFKRPVERLVQSMDWLECLDWFSDSHSNNATEEAFDTFVSPDPPFAPRRAHR